MASALAAAGGYFGPIQNGAKNLKTKVAETLAHGYSSKGSQRGLYNEYQHDRV